MTSPQHPQPPSRKPYITCREVLDFIMAYLDGELTPDQKHEFERHLGVCPSCVNYLDSYKATIKLGKAAMEKPDEPATGSVPEGLIRAIREARLKGAEPRHDAKS
jgi:anti-sigma factor RsiW